MRWFAAAAVLALLSAATAGLPEAGARQHYPARGHRIVAGGSAPPLDAMTTPSGAYSFRKLKSTYSGPAIRIRRASDNLEADINFLGCTTFTGCPWDEVAAAAHCASTSCFIVTAYDQSGNARHLTQAVAASQPALVLGCQGGLACLQTTDVAQSLAAAGTVTPATGLVSFSVVGNRTAGTGGCLFIRENGNANRLTAGITANVWRLLGGTSGSILPAANDNQWHSAQAVINAAASVFSIDGLDTTGTATGNTTAGTPALVGNAATTCRQNELIFWDNYALTAGERTALTNNQRALWGF